MASVRWLAMATCFVTAACGSSSKPAESTATAAHPVEAPASTASTAALPAMPVEPATAAPADTSRNPFEGARFYVDPHYVQKVESSASAAPESAATIRKVSAFPTGLWLDNIERVGSVGRWLDDAAAQEKASGQPVVPVFLVYDLPNRDCSAKSSAGELTVENGGEERYRREFIDKIAAEFAARPSQRIVALIEPDSVGNLATNMNVPKCAASEKIYRASIAYAISKLSLPNVWLYLDAAHAGWLGWDANRAKVAEIYKDILTAAGGVDRIRGFATNVSNYNVVKGDDGKRMEPSNPCPDETTYVQKLAESLKAVGITNKGFIIDTSRNGRGGIRSTWGNWCNIKGAGLGERPRVAPEPLVDAYFWVKPPGDSDGTADTQAARFDANCTSTDAAPGAPEAGHWFHSYFLDLVKNANPPL